MSTSASSDVLTRKPRFTFTVQRDIFLMKSLLNANPWQYGESQWKEVVAGFGTRGWEVTAKSLKSRIELLRQQYKEQNLPKTGTESEKTERGDLILEIENMIDAAKALNNIPVIINRGAFDIGLDPDFTQSEDLDEDVIIQATLPDKKTLLNEKNYADSERDKALKRMSDEPPEPTGTRKKRVRLLEEELMEKRQLHEMQMESRKQELEEARERRLQEEGQRRDGLAASQIEVQSKQLELQKVQMDQQSLMLELLTKLIK